MSSSLLLFSSSLSLTISSSKFFSTFVLLCKVHKYRCVVLNCSASCWELLCTQTQNTQIHKYSGNFFSFMFGVCSTKIHKKQTHKYRCFLWIPPQLHAWGLLCTMEIFPPCYNLVSAQAHLAATIFYFLWSISLYFALSIRFVHLVSAPAHLSATIFF